jgi:hypothetical protein
MGLEAVEHCDGKVRQDVGRVIEVNVIVGGEATVNTNTDDGVCSLPELRQ